MYLSFRYKEGPTQAKAVPVNLASGYSAQMSLANPNSPGTPLVTLTSNEGGGIMLFTGVNEPNIKVKLNKSLTLSGGSLPPGSYVYDLFVRNSSGDQIKVVEGTINVRRSVTQWGTP